MEENDKRSFLLDLLNATGEKTRKMLGVFPPPEKVTLGSNPSSCVCQSAPYQANIDFTTSLLTNVVYYSKT